MLGLAGIAIAGIAGVSEVAGVQFRLTATISPGFGYTGIVVAMLGGLAMPGVLLAIRSVARAIDSGRDRPLVGMEREEGGVAAVEEAMAARRAVETVQMQRFLAFLGTLGLWDPWETHYGEVARAMRRAASGVKAGSKRMSVHHWMRNPRRMRASERCASSAGGAGRCVLSCAPYLAPQSAGIFF